MKRKVMVIGILLLGGAAVALGLFWPFGNGAEKLTLYGTVEVQEVRLGSKIGGRVEKVMVREGETVKANQALVWFEVPELKTQRDQFAAQLHSAQTELERVERSLPLELKVAKEAADAAEAEYERIQKSLTPEIEMARHDVKTAEADAQLAQLEYRRTLELVQRNQAVSKSDYDKALATKQMTEARTASARIKLKMLENTEESILTAAKSKWQQALANFQKLNATRYQLEEVARAQVNEMKAKLEEIKVNLEEAVVRAPEKAVVEVVAVRKGDLITPNQPVVRILRADDMWVKVYVPETQLGKLRLNQKVDVFVDAYPDRAFGGQISQIGNTAEFTPRNVQSVEERRYQVFPVKIRVDEPQGAFRAGMAARVEVPLTNDQ